MPHLKLTIGDRRGRNNLKIGHRHEITDFQLAFAHDCQGRRFHATDADHAAGALAESYGRGTGEGEIVDLVGLPARYGSGVEACIFRVRLGATEGVANRLIILCGEQHPHDLAAVVIMLENFLAYKLALTVAVGRQPDPLRGSQCVANGFELGSFVAAVGRLCAVEPFGA